MALCALLPNQLHRCCGRSTHGCCNIILYTLTRILYPNAIASVMLCFVCDCDDGVFYLDAYYIQWVVYILVACVFCVYAFTLVCAHVVCTRFKTHVLPGMHARLCNKSHARSLRFHYPMQRARLEESSCPVNPHVLAKMRIHSYTMHRFRNKIYSNVLHFAYVYEFLECLYSVTAFVYVVCCNLLLERCASQLA